MGAGALVRENTTVGAWSLTGMGSTVLADVPPGEVWAGSPARRLRAAGGPALDELRADGEETGRRPETRMRAETRMRPETRMGSTVG